jgi:flagellar hook-basal body complex protein FliE
VTVSVPRIDALPVAANEAAAATGIGDVSAQATGATPAVSFESVLGGALQEASAADAVASQKVQALATGAIDDLHGTMISVKEADIAIKLVGTVRNKILDAFNELWRTSV